jgi:uncharacterized protein with FMN-binding domain
VRNGTKAFVSLVSLGVIAGGYQAGLAAEVQNGFSATAPVIDQNPAAATSATPAATTDASATPAASTPTDSAAPVETPATSAETTTAAAPVSTPKPKASSSAAAPAPVVAPEPATNAAGTTKNGSAVQYRYGTIQVSVTKVGGKITAVNLLQEGATGGRQAAFSYLVDMAIQANGSNFGNLSGATYTVDAFKQSLEAALAKF